VNEHKESNKLNTIYQPVKFMHMKLLKRT